MDEKPRIGHTMKPTRGGSRPNAGRKPTGKNTVTKSISLVPEMWEKLDKMRGEQTRSAWISSKIKKAKP